MFVSYSHQYVDVLFVTGLCSLSEIQIVIVKRHEYYAVAENVVVLPFLKVKKALNNFIQTDL